jgi:hypothetical protein
MVSSRRSCTHLNLDSKELDSAAKLSDGPRLWSRTGSRHTSVDENPEMLPSLVREKTNGRYDPIMEKFRVPCKPYQGVTERQCKQPYANRCHILERYCEPAYKH